MVKRSVCAAVAASLFFIPLVSLATTAEVSHNWSGYVVRSKDVTSVSGSWKIPAGIPQEAGDSAWIGIGGMDGHSDLIQTGVVAITRAGVIKYEAWYELYPALSVTIPLRIAPGDSIFASIMRLSSGSWLVYLNDETAGTYYFTTVSYASSETSAEWVTERSLAAKNSAALDPFRDVSFSSLSATVQGRTITPGDVQVTRLRLVKNGQLMLQPSALGALGNSFTLTQ